jgi:spoIIIJ-associated protein
VEWVETTGRTVEDAKEAALDQLGVDESDAEFTVVAEARAGLFGRLRSEARVRARIRPTAVRPKDDRRDRRRRARANGEGEDASPRASGEETVAVASGESAGSRPRSTARSARGTSAADPRDAGVVAGAGAEASVDSGDDRRPDHDQMAGDQSSGGGTSSPSSSAKVERPATEAGRGAVSENGASTNARRRSTRGTPPGSRSATDRATASTDNGQEGVDVEVALDEQGRIAQEFLTQLVAEFGVDAAVDVVRPDDDTVDLHLTGSDLGLLIGPKGATLLALQDLTRTVVHHQTGAGNGRIHVDVGGYQQKRSEALIRFAHQVASAVQASGSRTVLEPMTAADRKVVHDAITPIEGVSTISEGEEPQRRVVVVPADS